MTVTKYRINIFGKPGCSKCKQLMKRVDSLLEKEEFAEFDRQYWDLSTLDGLVKFARTECINPNRIPAFTIDKVDQETGWVEPLRPTNQSEKPEWSYARLYSLFGMQTDYTDKGKGLLTPDMLTTVMKEAKVS